MPVKISCPDCGAFFNVAELNFGRIGRCKHCGTQFRLNPYTSPEDSYSATNLDSGPSPAYDPDGPIPSKIGRFPVVRRLGKGGMGTVYLCHDVTLDRPIALKVPHPGQDYDRFLREARAAAKFRHPNFCPIFEIGDADGTRYLAMDFIEGQSLSGSILPGQPWEPKKAAEVVRQLALALAEAHSSGIIHRDLKPANIMVDTRGTLILMDFGLARMVGGTDLTLTGAIMGTPAYMSPEQADAEHKAIGPRSDIYSLGVIFYEMLAGRRPFTGSMTRVLTQILMTEPEPPSVHHPAIDPALESICLKAMTKQIEARFDSMNTFTRSLQDWLDAPSQPARPGMSVAPASTAHSLPRPHSTPPNPILPTPPAGQPWAWVLAGSVSLIVILLANLNRFRDQPDNKIARRDEPVPTAIETQALTAVQPRTSDPTPAKDSSEPTRSPEIFSTPKPEIKRVEDRPAPVPPSAPRDPDTLTNSIGIKLKLIPAGEFLMGSDASDTDASDDEKVAGKKHKVRITHPFYLGTTEVTVGQFRRFIETSGYKTEAESDGIGGIGWDQQASTFKQDPKYTWRSPGFKPYTDDHPVVEVSWNDANAFCAWLTRQDGQAYRLPTEAEWEYSCRAGGLSPTKYRSGDDPEGIALIGNIRVEKDEHIYTAPVESFPVNKFGLYDMYGNVWEWCFDWYDPAYYSESPEADPLELAQGACRVIRGGSWGSDPRSARSARRNWSTPDFRDAALGFRVARVRSRP